MDARDNTITRTDTVMVMSLKDGEISAASIPRDTKRIPNPFGDGNLGKVNSVLRDIYVSNGDDLDKAMGTFETVIEKTMQIEIDYHALVWFDGFDELVDQVDGGSRGIEVNIGTTINDARHHDQPGDPFGVYFPESTVTRSTRSIRRARPAMGTATASSRSTPILEASGDMVQTCAAFRSNPPRGQRLHPRPASATIHRGNDRGRGPVRASGMVDVAMAAAKGKWVTNFPITLGAATELYDVLQGADSH